VQCVGQLRQGVQAGEMSGQARRQQDARGDLGLAPGIGKGVGQSVEQAALEGVEQEEVRHLLGRGVDGGDLAPAQGVQDLVGLVRELSHGTHEPDYSPNPPHSPAHFDLSESQILSQ
jgi:hypothetical protein